MSSDERWFQGHLAELDRDECLELLASTPVGRVAYCDDEGPVVIPVNHVVEGEDVLFRISGGSVMARRLGPVAAFQVDAFDDFRESGWSVLVRGRVSWVDLDGTPDEARPTPWAEGLRDLLVRITPTTITGRRLLPA